ncbi:MULTISPECIES: SRPBCC family protein [unclassified Streptomyces]|uniref:SRPBCC family protein n=1 Tax=unclassified Streptomyces TaxID=2593676 RepID=UPI0007ECE38D|nr:MULTISPECIES: SRPBCC family protein [unclassified Streptomyces]MCP3771478.1 SRPBCC family protein [Streptomyces sp. MAR25Y5]OBQ52949.1 carbon monoxide dehydrogenase [Streptomyces sp. H-KF8]
MELHHEFTVPVPVDDAWPALLDIERVAPCLPGATVEEYDGRTVTGSVKVKVGPVTVTYRGTAVFEERDEAARRMVLAASGRETRGQGTARATVTATLGEQDGGTAVSVRTDLTVTGRPAQFGRGVLAEVGERLIGRFAACLSEQLTRPPGAAGETGAAGGISATGTAGETVAADTSGAAVAAGAPQAVRSSGAPPDEPLDLLRTAGLPVAKRAAAVLAGAVVLGLLAARIRARRRA